MAFSTIKRQKLSYVVMIVLTIMLTLMGYHYLNLDWRLFREAENRFNTKQFAASIPFYLDSFKAGLTHLPAMEHLGDAYAAIDNFPEAIYWYRKYLEQNPYDRNVRLALARALTWNGELEKAKEEYQLMLKDKP